MKCSTNCGDGRRYREVYCKDDTSSRRLSGHLCHKDEIPITEELCRGMQCNEINHDFDERNNYNTLDKNMLDEQVKYQSLYVICELGA